MSEIRERVVLDLPVAPPGMVRVVVLVDPERAGVAFVSAGVLERGHAPAIYQALGEHIVGAAVRVYLERNCTAIIEQLEAAASDRARLHQQGKGEA